MLSLFTLTFILLLSGCGKQSSPEKTVDTLFESVKDLDVETLSTLVVDSAKDDLEEDVGELASEWTDLDDTKEIDYDAVKGLDDAKKNLQDILSDLSYSVVETNKDKDSATVTVKAEFVDGEELVSNVISDLFGEILGQAFSGEELSEEESISQMATLFNKNYAVFEKTLMTDTVDIHLVKEEGKWLLSEMDSDLMNVLAFNLFDGVENLFSGLLGNDVEE